MKNYQSAKIAKNLPQKKNLLYSILIELLFNPVQSSWIQHLMAVRVRRLLALCQVVVSE